MHTPSPSLGRVIWLVFLGTVVLGSSLSIRGADKRIVLIAGKPSHPPGMHEFRAGCLLLQKALASVPGITVQVYDGGWPSKVVDGTRVDDNAALDNADAVLIYSDGGRGNYLVLYSPAARQTYTYFHMLAPSSLKPGRRVRAGGRVGALGCSGSCDGAHLHFEVHRGRGATGRGVDPMPLLRRWHRLSRR